jgi:hypothetical protein
MCSYLRPALLLAALATPATAADEPSRAAEALRGFEKGWTPLKGRAYMRPLEDAGWKARMAALRALARSGDATPVLVAALKKGEETRVFAAQALALLPGPRAKDALLGALKDSHPAVRLYAAAATRRARWLQRLGADRSNRGGPGRQDQAGYPVGQWHDLTAGLTAAGAQGTRVLTVGKASPGGFQPPAGHRHRARRQVRPQGPSPSAG